MTSPSQNQTPLYIRLLASGHLPISETEVNVNLSAACICDTMHLFFSFLVYHVQGGFSLTIIAVSPNDFQENVDSEACCWRNMFSCINLLRILEKLTKWKHSRTMVSREAFSAERVAKMPRKDVHNEAGRMVNREVHLIVHITMSVVAFFISSPLPLVSTATSSRSLFEELTNASPYTNWKLFSRSSRILDAWIFWLIDDRPWQFKFLLLASVPCNFICSSHVLDAWIFRLLL